MRVFGHDDSQKSGAMTLVQVTSIQMTILLAIVAFGVVPMATLGAESAHIGTILQQPAEAHLRIIRLHGGASDVQRVEDSYRSKDKRGCAGSYHFPLRDDSGGIAVEVRRTCGPSHQALPHITDGHTMRSAARTDAPGYDMGQEDP